MPAQTSYKKRAVTKFMDRANNARTIQTAYRRFRNRTTDQRQLSSVVASHRRANPYQITPSAGRTVTFWRKVQINIPLSQSLGFGAVGNNLNWGFSLGRIVGFTDGVFTTTALVSNASEFQALFDYYKIEAVKMQMFFTRTNDSLTTSNNLGMPIMLIANDFDDIAETMTLNTMNERVGVRYVQFDSSNSNGISHYIKPKPVSVLVQTNVDTGVLSSANAGVTFGTQWLDAAQSNIVHNGIKIFYNNQAVTGSTVLGNVTFVFDICYVFKGYR